MAMMVSLMGVTNLVLMRVMLLLSMVLGQMM